MFPFSSRFPFAGNWMGGQQLPMQCMMPGQAAPQMPTLPTLPAQAAAQLPQLPFAGGQFMPPGLQGRTDLPGPFAGGTFNPHGMGQGMPAPQMPTLPQQAMGRMPMRGLLG